LLIIIVDDRHAEQALRGALAGARARGLAADVLTADAMLAMRLRREGMTARLTIDGLTRATLAERDRMALDGVAAACGRYAEALGTDFGPYLQYTLIPAFMRAVRNFTAVDDVLAELETQNAERRIPNPESRIPNPKSLLHQSMHRLRRRLFGRRVRLREPAHDRQRAGLGQDAGRRARHPQDASR